MLAERREESCNFKLRVAVTVTWICHYRGTEVQRYSHNGNRGDSEIDTLHVMTCRNVIVVCWMVNVSNTILIPYISDIRHDE